MPPCCAAAAAACLPRISCTLPCAAMYLWTHRSVHVASPTLSAGSLYWATHLRKHCSVILRTRRAMTVTRRGHSFAWLGAGTRFASASGRAAAVVNGLWRHGWATAAALARTCWTCRSWPRAPAAGPPASQPPDDSYARVWAVVAKSLLVARAGVARVGRARSSTTRYLTHKADFHQLRPSRQCWMAGGPSTHS